MRAEETGLREDAVEDGGAKEDFGAEEDKIEEEGTGMLEVAVPASAALLCKAITCRTPNTDATTSALRIVRTINGHAWIKAFISKKSFPETGIRTVSRFSELQVHKRIIGTVVDGIYAHPK